MAPKGQKVLDLYYFFNQTIFQSSGSEVLNVARNLANKLDALRVCVDNKWSICITETQVAAKWRQSLSLKN